MPLSISFPTALCIKTLVGSIAIPNIKASRAPTAFFLLGYIILPSREGDGAVFFGFLNKIYTRGKINENDMIFLFENLYIALVHMNGNQFIDHRYCYSNKDQLMIINCT
jgi:hypothetical protein